MFPAYRDILDLADACGKTADWFDEHGVPRFRPFHPSMLGVYDCFALLARVRCADRYCGAEILVGVGWQKIDLFALVTGREDSVVRSVEALVAGFDLGDPPRHDCPGAGERMFCDLAEIVEVWERPGAGEWVRRADLEGPVADAGDGDATPAA